MKKEIFFAILAGGLLGLVIAYGAWRANIALRPKVTPHPNSSSEVSPTPSPTLGDFKVVLVKPDSQAVIAQTPTLLSGVTRPNTYVVVSGESGDNILNASASGAFTSNVDLQGGINQILVSAFDTDGSEADSNVLVVYSSQFTLPQGSTATTSGNPVLDNVQAKLKEASASPQAYIGIVTDISNSSIQIKTANGDIQQISGNANTAYINTTNNNVKTIKQTDVAIGDFIVAMGVKDGNNVLMASRVLVTDPITAITRRAFYGVVTDDTQVLKITIKNNKSGESTTVVPDTGISVTGAESSFGKISKNEKVIAVGEFKNGTLTARTILVLK